MGLHPSEIYIGYDKASKKTMELLETLTEHKLENPRDKTELVRCIKSVIASKQFGLEDFLSELIADAAIFTMPNNIMKFNVDNVRI